MCEGGAGAVPIEEEHSSRGCQESKGLEAQYSAQDQGCGTHKRRGGIVWGILKTALRGKESHGFSTDSHMTAGIGVWDSGSISSLDMSFIFHQDNPEMDSSG